MESVLNNLEVIEKQQIEIDLLRQQNAQLLAKLQWFEEQLRLGQHKRFAPSSEKMSSEQGDLFNEAEAEAKPEAVEPAIEEITYRRRKQTGKREEMFESLPVETIEYRLPAEEQICSCCGGALHEMSTEVRRELKIIPAQASVVEHIKFVYACRHCEKEDITTPIVTATMPQPVIPGSFASPSAIAYTMSQKFVESMPLYRQEQHYHRLGIDLSRQTMANWMIESSERWLKPVYDHLHELLLERDIACADETTFQVLHEPGRAAQSKSYLWLYRTGSEKPAIILYDYQTTRAGKHPERFLKGFKGFLCVDGYNGYNGLPDIKLVGCFSHARRYFFEALKALPANARGSPVAAQEGLDFCNQLFAIERDLADLSPEDRYAARLEQSRPVMDAFGAWLKMMTPRVLPKSALGKAIQYSRNQWDKLENFLLDGRLEISNNRSERSIKPCIIGRKNWLFANTPRGAKSSATIYSIVETAKENGVNPFTYLTYLFEKLPNMDIRDKSLIDGIMPWSASLPDFCKINKKSSDTPS